MRLPRVGPVEPRCANVPEVESSRGRWLFHRAFMNASGLAGVVGYCRQDGNDDTRQRVCGLSACGAAGDCGADHHVGCDFQYFMDVLVQRCIAVARIAASVCAEAFLRPRQMNKGNASIHDSFGKRSADLHGPIVPRLLSACHLGIIPSSVLAEWGTL